MFDIDYTRPLISTVTCTKYLSIVLSFLLAILQGFVSDKSEIPPKKTMPVF